MKKLIVTIAVLLTACLTDESEAIRTLEASGFTDIKTTGYNWLECGEDDAFHTGFTAKNSQGRRVSGTVCCGFLGKGCTVRF